MTGINLVLSALFILVTAVITVLVSGSQRWKVILVTSLLFYYLLLGDKLIVILALSLITWTFGKHIHSRNNVTWIALILLLIPLLIVKSINSGNHFQNYQIQIDVSPNNWFTILQIAGLSYFTFNSISYLIDIKRKYITPEKNFFLLLLYLTYFPAIFSGPLHRAKYLFQEFKHIEVTDHSISKGMRLILWGLFKNVVIAQRIFILMTQLQNSEIGGIYYFLIGFLFFLYLYCNFSSFIDFFQGVSQIFTIRLKHNFRNRVYLSSSRQEFWKGWHITLNHWFRDYFFFVISGYDKKRKYTDILLLITFLLIALWHGFSVIMAVWGLMNGLWIVIEKRSAFEKWKHASFRKVAGVFYHIFIATILALIFISPQPDFLYQKVFLQSSKMPSNFFQLYLPSICIIIVFWGIMDYHYAKAGDTPLEEYLDKKPTFLRWIIYAKLVMIILIFGKSTGIENYYIQF